MIGLRTYDEPLEGLQMKTPCIHMHADPEWTQCTNVDEGSRRFSTVEHKTRTKKCTKNFGTSQTNFIPELKKQFSENLRKDKKIP